MDNLLVIIGSIALIVFIGWWFFGKRRTDQVEATRVGDRQQVEVVVNGGYAPDTVVLKQGEPASIVFDRRDPSGCFSHVVFPDFGINEELPVGQAHSIEIDTSKAGEYQYACGMNMFHGKVIVK